MPDWSDLREPASSSRPDLLAFFGIPPAPESDLEQQIGVKRRKWRRLETSTKKGGQIASQVCAVIQQASEALLNGVPMPDATTPVVEEAPLTATLVPVDDLLDHVLGLCIGGNLHGALEVSERAREAYPESWIPDFTFAYVVQVGWEAAEITDPNTLARGLQSAERALQMHPTDPAVWSTTGSLLGATGQYDRLDLLLAEAGRQLSSVPHGLLVSAALGQIRRGDLENGAAAAVRAVAGDPTDKAARNDLAVLLVHVAAAQLLPISSPAAMKSYEEIVAVAAWCAVGVPEAEAVVRPHRMWAARARTKVFVGNDVWRTAIATYTAFLLLPLHNAISSRPAWKVLAEGPQGRGASQLWTVWSFSSAEPLAWRGTTIQELHRDHLARSPWMQQYLQAS